MAKAKKQETTFNWNTDPAIRFGQLVEAAELVEEMKNQAIREAFKAGYGRTDISKKSAEGRSDRTPVASSTVYHAMIRAGVHTPGESKKVAAAKSIKATPAKAKTARVTKVAKPKDKTATAAATRSVRTIKARAK